MAERCVFTYQTRLVLAPEQAQALNAYAELHGRAQRCLHAALRRHRSLNELKREFLPRFGLTARQFNGIRVELDGKVEAILQRRPQLIEEAKVRLAKAHRLVNKLAQNSPGTNKLHQKKRRLAVLEQRLAALQRDEADGQVRLCFGSRRLFHAQYNLQANGLSDHEEWLDQWREALSRQFFVLGSQDETAGNQTCQAAVCEDGSLQLKLRLPDALMQECGARFLMIYGVRFAHGHGPIVSALGMSRVVSATTRAGKPASRRVGRAISYRFLRDDKGWRVFASVEVDAAAVTTSPALGCTGIDINADHLAVAEVDRFGNLVDVRRIELPTRGKSSDQVKALIGDAAVQVAALAQARGKPLALEKLDFRKKKAELEAVDPARSRLLSSFVFSRMTSALKAASLRAGVEVIEVNPAFTSIIGAVNHAQRRGISVHQGAACAVARRGLGLREAPAVREAIVPLRNGGHVTFAVPARNRAKHVWQQWSGIRTCLKAAHAAHWRSGSSTDPPAPLSPATQASSAHRLSTAQSRGANRSQHCSGSVMDDIPF
ncbi:transposase [uncultured Azohydromonas sp.]|jgi:transposase, IS605 OrfB family, central region|uniref:transposase n=1 Tax=uncultured Azohydromonas sp. TaxID=487342 RepID=UPI0026301829|nr:transposase [uncultured Azohydromonas sp.]